jgi:hypothetical protein
VHGCQEVEKQNKVLTKKAGVAVKACRDLATLCNATYVYISSLTALRGIKQNYSRGGADATGSAAAGAGAFSIIFMRSRDCFNMSSSNLDFKKLFVNKMF